MPFNALRAVGMVLGRAGDGDEYTFLGSCFALRESTAVVTAAHCVGDLTADRLAVRTPHGVIIVNGPGSEVLEVIRHPNADVAILRLNRVEWSVEPFWNYLGIHGLGEDVFAYGLPENVLSERQPTARLFKGYVQRVFWHTSFMGFAYAGLDFACPAGLSGGPIFRPQAPQMVLGVATENCESTTYLDAIEETTREGSTVRTQYQRVLSYGVAVQMEAIDEWLDEHLAVFDTAAWTERERAREG